jgi:hypothetical protein
MTLAMSAVMAGWIAWSWAKERKETSLYAHELPVKVNLMLEEHGVFSQGRLTLEYQQDPPNDLEDDFWIWEVDGALRDEKGRRYESGSPDQLRHSPGLIGREMHHLLGKALAGEGLVYLDSFSTVSSRLARGLIQQNRSQKLSVAWPNGEPVSGSIKLQGRLAGKRCRIDRLVEDLPWGQSRLFQAGDLLGEVTWVEGTYPDEPLKLQLRVSEPLTTGRPTAPDHWRRDKNWLVLLRYPKAGVALTGDSNPQASRVGVMGLTGWTRRYRFEHSELHHFEVGDEVPLLSIYRGRVEELGFVEVESDLLDLPQPHRQPPGSDLHSLGVVTGGSTEPTGAPTSDVWAMRPEPESGSRRAVGGWLRTLAGYDDYPGKNRDLAQFADRHGDLFWETWKKAGGGNRIDFVPFVNGAPDRWRNEADEALGEIEGTPSVLVTRGWAESVREKTRQLIADGNRDPEILRLGLYLGLNGIESAVLEGLVQHDDERLDQAAASHEAIAPRLNEVLDQRLERLEEEIKRRWQADPEGFRFRVDPWVWLLQQGRRQDLESCLAWMSRVRKSGNDRYYENRSGSRARFAQVLLDQERFEAILKADLLQSENFRWDPVLRRWEFQYESNSK